MSLAAALGRDDARLGTLTPATPHLGHVTKPTSVPGVPSGHGRSGAKQGWGRHPRVVTGLGPVKEE